MTEKQKAFLEENFRKMNDRELMQKLSEFGPETDEAAFAEALREIESDVFDQSVSEEELAFASGGSSYPCGSISEKNCEEVWREEPTDNCSHNMYRDIYGGNGFANCAATVEDGSFCYDNDACYRIQVKYTNRKDCWKAWQ